MPVSLSVKNVPDDIVSGLKERARMNHRSLQGELISILEQAARPGCVSLTEMKERIAAMGLKTPDEAVRMVREIRNGRLRH